jgi:hypothetical protein
MAARRSRSLLKIAFGNLLEISLAGVWQRVAGKREG